MYDLCFDYGGEADIREIALALIPPFEPRFIDPHDDFAPARYPDCDPSVIVTVDHDDLIWGTDEEEELLLWIAGSKIAA